MLSSLVVVVSGLAGVVSILVMDRAVLGVVLVAPRVLRLVDGVGGLVLGVVVVTEFAVELLRFVVNAVGGLIDVLVVGDHGVVLVVDGTGVGLVLELDVRLLLVVLLVVGVVVDGLLVVHGVLMEHMGVLVVVLIGLLVGEFVMRLLVVRVVLAVVSILVVNGLVDNLVAGLVVSKSLVRGDVVGRNGVIVVVNWLVVEGSLVSGLLMVDWLVGTGVLPHSVGVVCALTVAWEGVTGDLVLHLTAKENLGETKTDRVTELVEMLVLPLGFSIHDFVVDILAVHDEVVLDVEDEVPRVSEGLGHLAELVKVSSDGGLALLELVGDVVNDVTEVLDGVEDRVEGRVLELVNDTTEALPDVLGVTEALNTVRNLSLNGTSEHTLENLAHAEESEVNV